MNLVICAALIKANPGYMKHASYTRKVRGKIQQIAGGRAATLHNGTTFADRLMLNQWSQDANDSAGSVRLRIGVARLLGKNPQKDIDKARSAVKTAGGDLARFDAMVKETMLDKRLLDSMKRIKSASQSHYAGKKTVTVYRGITGEQAASLRRKHGAGALRAGKTLNLAINTLTSMSENADNTYNIFGGGAIAYEGEEEPGFIFQIEVPVKDIIASYRAFPAEMTINRNGHSAWELLVSSATNVIKAKIIDPETVRHIPRPSGYAHHAEVKKQALQHGYSEIKIPGIGRKQIVGPHGIPTPKSWHDMEHYR